MNLPEENPSLALGLGLGGSPLHAEIGLTNGISVSLGKQPQPPGSSSRVEVAFHRQGNSKGKSQHNGLTATDPLGNSPVPVPLPLLPGELNYQHFDTRGVYSQSLPQEMQRFPNNNDGVLSGPWEEILSLVNAPLTSSSSSSVVPEIGMGNTSIRHISVPDSYSQGNSSHFIPQTPVTGPLGLGETSGMLSSWNLDGAYTKHLIPTSYSQGDSLGSTLRQSIMTAPPQPVASQNGLLIHNFHEYGYDMSNSLSPEVSNLILSNETSSVQLTQGYCLASDRWSSSTCFPRTQQDAFPVPYYQQPRYTPNYTNDNSSPSISSHCFYFAPATPQPAEKSESQLNSATLNLSMDQNLNQGKVQQQTLPASSTITYYSQLTPPLVQSLKTYENHHQDLAVLNLPLNQEIGNGNCQQQAFGSCTKNKSVQHDCQEVIQNIVNSSSAALGTPQKESISEIGVNQNIDLNKTPAQKPPKRRKHRPKVIVENKIPKNKKPACPKAATEGVKVEKRKYERKNRPNPMDALQSKIEEDNASYIEPVSKTCRRVLNFDQDNDVLIGSKFINQPGMKCLGKANTSENSNAQETVCSIDNFTLQNSQPNKQKGNEVGTISSSHLTNCEMQVVSSPMHSQKRPATHTMLRNLTSELPYISTSDTTDRSIDPCQSTKGIGCMSTNPPIYGEMGHPVTQTRLATAKKQITKSIAPEKQQQVHEYRYPIGPTKILSQNPDHESGCFASTNFTSSLLLCQEIFQNKRKKVERESQRTGTSMQFSANQEGANQNQRNGHLLNHIAKVNDVQLNSYHKGITAGYPCTGPSNSMNLWQSHLTSPGRNIMKQQNKVGVCLVPNKVVENREKPSISSHILKSLNGGVDTKMLQQEPFNKASGAECLVNGATIGITSSTMQFKKQNEVPLIPKVPSHSTGPDQKQKKMISVEDIIDLLGCLNLNTTKQKQQNALVPYKADGSVVPYQGFEPLRKRRARPKVDLDPETMRLWKVLMRQDVTDDDSKTDEEKEKWWEEERKVFRGRADSFIARMHLVQGDRRFSPWKGSVVDSVIGVFLTQNVSDHLSSSAFMSLAARFPVQSTKTVASLSDGPIMIVEEPEVCMLTTNERLPRHDSLNKGIYTRTSGESSQQERHDLPSASGIEQLTGANSWRSEEFISLQDSAESSNVLATEGIQSSESSSREHYHTNSGNFNSELLAFNHEEMNNTIKLPETNCVSGKLFYEASTIGHWQFQNAVRTSKQKQPDGVDNISSFSTISHSFDLNCPDVQLPAISFSNDQLHLASGLEQHKTDSLHTLKPQPSMYLHSRASEVTLVDDDVATMEQISQETILFQNRQAQPQGPPPAENPFATFDKQTVDMRNIMPLGVESCCHLSSGGIHPQDITMSSLFGIKSAKDPFHTQIDTVQAPASSQDHADQRSSVDTSILGVEKGEYIEHKTLESNIKEQICPSSETSSKIKKNEPKAKGKRPESKKKTTFDWDSLRKQAESTNGRKGRSKDTTDSIDYKTLQHANVKDISEAIRERGMNNMLAERMKAFLNRVVRDHGSIDLEWLRDITPDKAKDYLLSIQGLGLKSVECIRLLTLHQHAFPVDTNVGRIAVRLGWVPLQPLPESLQLHLLELYPVLESIQKYLWPRLCNLDQRTLYELHYQLITFGKVFCTKSKPNCNACPMRAECRHFASAFASSRLALPGQEDKSIVISDIPIKATKNPTTAFNPVLLHSSEIVQTKETSSEQKRCDPIVEEPSTPEPEVAEILETDIEDFDEDPDEIPTIRLNVEEFAVNLQNFMQENMELQEGDMSRALVALDSKAASIPMPKLKNVNRLRTEHQVYQLPDTHPLLKELDVREPDDPSPYLLAIWTPGETSNSIQPPEERCASQEAGNLCSDNTCFTCNSIREANSQTVRGTLLIPCRTAMRGSFPLNGTYFQVNEVFADHESSLNPIDVPRLWIWNLPRRTVYFGTSVTTIFKGMSTEEIQYCFWRGFVCVRGFDLQTRAPRPLTARLHFPASKQVKLAKKEI